MLKENQNTNVNELSRTSLEQSSHLIGPSPGPESEADHDFIIEHFLASSKIR